MASQITMYQCPACTGPLHFDEKTGKLSCDYCESSFTPEQIEAVYAERNARAETAMEEKNLEEKAPEENGWGEDAEKMRAYNCTSCGAQLICEETTAATACPYCGNPAIVPGQFGGTEKPDFVIPFKLSKEAAVAELKRHYKGKFLLPKAFLEENHIQEIKGVYVPFWLFDAQVVADITYKAERVHSHRSGDTRIITTEHYDVWRKASVPFSRVPVDGASKMPDAYMDAIEPFDYNELKPFSLSYLPGFLADRYDVSREECDDRVQTRCQATAKQTVRDSVQGYTSCIPVQENMDVRIKDSRYVLLPVWLLSTKWKDKNYLFAMNGQTGKMVGELPISWKKFWLFFCGIYGVLALLLGLLM